MEKLCMEFGLAITTFFFMCMFVIGSQFIWGVIFGLLVTLFGCYFYDE